MAAGIAAERIAPHAHCAQAHFGRTLCKDGNLHHASTFAPKAHSWSGLVLQGYFVEETKKRGEGESPNGQDPNLLKQ